MTYGWHATHTVRASFPARELIRGWLKAGVFEPGEGFTPTEEGRVRLRGEIHSGRHRLHRVAEPAGLLLEIARHRVPPA